MYPKNVVQVSNTISPEGIEYINSISTLVLKDHGGSGVEFRNKAGSLYRLWFIETMTIGSHRVFYFILWHIEGKLGGAADAEMGRMFVAIIVQFLKEHPNDLLYFCHKDNLHTWALHKIFLRWAHANQDLYEGRMGFFEGAGRNHDNENMHFIIFHTFACEDMEELKAFILENGNEFANCSYEQMDLLVEKAQENAGNSDKHN
jgi:hypothetical protein